uniref:Cadherin-5 n=1 Tax=Lygus hesperus TaxID=30085 RepID=A0A0A9W3G8_LYGHE
MPDFRQCDPVFLTEFIELYKSFPCLWQTKCKEYRDRNIKNLAYEQLIKKFKEVDPTASKETVAKKINSLRTVHKKELLKVRRSGNVYSPSLWYYNLFSFLEDQDLQRTPQNTFDVKEENFTFMDQESADCEYSEDHEFGDTTSNPEENLTSQYSASSAQCILGPRKRKGSDDHQLHEVMGRAERRLESVATEDSFDRYGKHIADRLRQIKPHQIKFIQKLVSDVLFEGELEALNRNWKLVEIMPKESQSSTSSHQTVKPNSQ